VRWLTSAHSYSLNCGEIIAPKSFRLLCLFLIATIAVVPILLPLFLITVLLRSLRLCVGLFIAHIGTVGSSFSFLISVLHSTRITLSPIETFLNFRLLFHYHFTRLSIGDSVLMIAFDLVGAVLTQLRVTVLHFWVALI
jgi:hypothetical protein